MEAIDWFWAYLHKGGEKRPPSADQGLCTANSRQSHAVSTPQVKPPSPPVPPFLWILKGYLWNSVAVTSSQMFWCFVLHAANIHEYISNGSLNCEACGYVHFMSTNNLIVANLTGMSLVKAYLALQPTLSVCRRSYWNKEPSLSHLFVSLNFTISILEARACEWRITCIQNQCQRTASGLVSCFSSLLLHLCRHYVNHLQ